MNTVIHLSNCFCRRGHISGKKPKVFCSCVGDNNKNCTNPVSKKSCIELDGGWYYGFCVRHWKEYCEYKGWNHKVSKCVNQYLSSLEVPKFIIQIQFSPPIEKSVSEKNIIDLTGDKIPQFKTNVIDLTPKRKNDGDLERDSRPSKKARLANE